MGNEQLDRIYIRDLETRCIVGVNAEERTKKQDVRLNVILWADLRTACNTDQIEDTIDYKDIKLTVLEMVDNSSYQLIERLAEETARICLAYDAVQQVQVTIDKPGALRFARSVAVEITRTR